MKERTEAQKLASRLNGSRSRGPVTPEGKSRVALNAIKHGLHAKRVVLANEDPDLWDHYIEALNEEWQPETVTEIELIHDLAAARWRLYRVLDYETALMDLESLKSEDAYKKFLPEGDTETLNSICWQALNKDGTLPPIHRQEMRLRRIIRESLTQLLAIQTLRLARTSQQPAPEQPVASPAAATAIEQNKPGPLPAAAPAEPPPNTAGSKSENKPEPVSPKAPVRGDSTVFYVDYTRHRPAPGDPGQPPNRPVAPTPPDSKAA